MSGPRAECAVGRSEVGTDAYPPIYMLDDVSVFESVCSPYWTSVVCTFVPLVSVLPVGEAEVGVGVVW